MNTSSTDFDTALKGISHYQSFPAMLPFVGKDYISPKHSKLLILGESFYFPKDSTWHRDPSRWYSANQKSLNEGEVTYFNCRGLLEGPWHPRTGHAMYLEIKRCLDKFVLPSPDRSISHIAYTNTFMRPANVPGQSFEHYCKEQDITASVDVLTKVITALSPDLVIFASVYAWGAVGRRLAKHFPETKFDFVCHPTTGGLHWNRKTCPNGREKFVSLLNKWADKAGIKSTN